MNEQKPRPSVADNPGSSLTLHSIFHTIQGEGPFSGRPAVFIRLGGCNLQCPGCDTEYTVGSGASPVASIVKQARDLAANCQLVVVTGGEPFRQNIGELCDQLLSLNYTVQIETNGTLFPRDLNPLAHVVCSPKTGHVHALLHPFIDAYKYVLEGYAVDEDDGLPTSVLGKKIRPARPHAGYDGPIYVSPFDSGDTETNRFHIKAAVASCLSHDYILNLQVHKLVNLP